VVPRITSRPRSQREHLRRLAIVFKVEIRLKIVAELYVRAMSPKDFLGEFGGGSVSRVAQHFEMLERHGWLRRVGQKGGEPKRRGRPETLYRATGLAFFDAETWAMLPYSLRLASSWNLFKASARELRDGIEASFAEGSQTRDLTCTVLSLDPVGWTRVITELGIHFESIFEEQEDTRVRVARTGEEPIRAGIFQLGFEAPQGDDPLSLGLADGGYEPMIPFPERLAPIFADELSMEILAVLNERDMSVRRFHREFAGDASEWAVRYRFGRLRDLAWITVVDKVRRRGAYEQIYRATGPLVVDNGPWADVPATLEKTESWARFMHLSDLTRESIAAGTFDVGGDRHLSWSIVNLDRQGWHNVIAGLEAIEAFIRDEEKQARKRIEAGAEPLTMVVGLGAFESPSGRVKAP
jgi:hypothetical protein